MRATLTDNIDMRQRLLLLFLVEVIRFVLLEDINTFFDFVPFRQNLVCQVQRCSRKTKLFLIYLVAHNVFSKGA